jgi:O-antigen/teichoic acid export membrane protein
MPFSRSLLPVAAVLAIGRLIACGASLLLCLQIIPQLRQTLVVRTALVGPLIRFGGWLTVSNIISPLMVYLDRFLIGALLSVTAVTYYVTPYEAVTKLLFIPSAIVGVLFPAFSTSFVESRNRTEELLDHGLKYIFLALYPIILIMVTLAHEGLTFWLGKDFARLGAPVLQWLSVGILFNALAQIPFAQLQAAGQPNLTARLHLIELPCYLVALWWLITTRGIVGAAVVWMVRAGVDMAALLIFSRRLLPGSATIIRRVAVVTSVGVLVLGVGASLPALYYRLSFLVLALLGLTFTTWFFILTPVEKVVVQGRIRPSHISPYAD